MIPILQRSLVPLLFLGFIVCMPLLLQAGDDGVLGNGTTPAGNLGNGTAPAGDLGYGTTPSCSAGDSTCLKNPLDPSISSIPAFFLAILDILLIFAIPLVVFFIIYAGFSYVTARGNPGKIQQAHMALLYALIGAVLIFGARAILDIIKNTVGSVTYLGIERML